MIICALVKYELMHIMCTRIVLPNNLLEKRMSNRFIEVFFNNICSEVIKNITFSGIYILNA